MDAIQAILNRRSVRRYTDESIPEETFSVLLRAAMRAPSCMDCRDWAFLVIREKAELKRISDLMGPYAKMLSGAAGAIVVCGDLSRAYEPCPEYWVIDATMAAENILIAATALKIGSVFLGVYPEKDPVKKLSEGLQLPDYIIPLGVIALGYPQRENAFRERETFETDQIHYERW